MTKMNTYNHRIFAVAALCYFAQLFSACNKDFPNKLKESSSNDTIGINAKTRKVLYIIVDGVRGRALKAINAPNLSKISNNAIYAFDGLSDYGSNTVTNAGAWSNMLTGVSVASHGVMSEDFAGNKLNLYPSMFTRLKQYNIDLKTVSVASSTAFDTNLAADATTHQVFANNDASVKNAVSEELKSDKATVVVAQFHGAEQAGATDSYDETSPAYVNAILKIDGYIGEIMTALSRRKTYSDENWLVVIASNKGGVIPRDPNSTDFTSYGDATRNNFVIFYNPRFSTLFVPKPDSEKIPYNSSSIRYEYTDATRPNALIPDPNQYNFGANGNYTIEVLIRTKTGDQYYPSFLSKRVTAFTGPGWNMFLEADYWMINSSVANQVKGRTINDDKWHKLTVVFDGTNKKVRTYTDGKFDSEQTMNTNNMNNTASLKLGYATGDGNTSASLMLSSLQIYNVALTTQDVSNYACKTIVSETNPNYPNLIGYWPMNEGVGNTLKEKSGKGTDLTVGSKGVWESFNDVAPALCPEINESFFRLVPNNIDIPFEIYQWLGISIPTNWKLEGRSWNPIYSDIKP